MCFISSLWRYKTSLSALQVFTVGGTVETISIPASAATFGPNPTWEWAVNLTFNSQVVMTATDYYNADGGTSILQTVVAGVDTSCLNSGPTSNSASAKSLPTGALVGIILGGVIGIAIIIFLSWLLVRSRRRSRGVSAYIDDEPIPERPQDGHGGAPDMQEFRGPAPFMQYAQRQMGSQSPVRPYSYGSSSDGQLRPDSTLTSDYSKGSQSPTHNGQPHPEELPPMYQDFGATHRPVDVKASYQAPLANYASTSQVHVGPSSQVELQASSSKMYSPPPRPNVEEEFNPYI